MEDQKNEADFWPSFMNHLGIYLVVMTIAGGINLLTFRTPVLLWAGFLWGCGLAAHLVIAATAGVEEAGGKLLRHAGVTAALVGALFGLNLFLFKGAPWVLWLGLALVASVGIHWLAYVTEGLRQEDQVDEEIADLNTHLQRAIRYQDQIGELIAAAPNRQVKKRLQGLSDQIARWVETLKDLAQRVERVKQNPLIREDLTTVPQAIARLEAELATETDADIRAALEQTLANRNRQLESLTRLQSLTQRAEIQMEHALSSLGTLYSQLLTDQSTNQVADYSHLTAEAEEETRALQDYLEALEEVKLGG